MDLNVKVCDVKKKPLYSRFDVNDTKEVATDLKVMLRSQKNVKKSPYMIKFVKWDALTCFLTFLLF